MKGLAVRDVERKATVEGVKKIGKRKAVFPGVLVYACMMYVCMYVAKRKGKMYRG